MRKIDFVSTEGLLFIIAVFTVILVNRQLEIENLEQTVISLELDVIKQYNEILELQEEVGLLKGMAK